MVKLGDFIRTEKDYDEKGRIYGYNDNNKKLCVLKISVVLLNQVSNIIIR